MSTNFLSLNQAKTVYLLIDLPKQLPKVSDAALLMPSNVTITLSDSAYNLGVIFDSSCTMSEHISSVSKNLALCLFVTFVQTEILSILLRLKLSLHLSFIPR